MGYFSSSKPKRDVKAKPDQAETAFRPLAPALAPSAGALLEPISILGPGMLVTGNIVYAGSVEIFGRVLGDIHASHLVIVEGAEVEGTMVAQDAVINGTFKGTIYGNSVELQSKAIVAGEIFNRSLAISRDAQFEGVARRLDKPVEAPSIAHMKDERPPFATTAEMALPPAATRQLDQ